MSLPPIQCTANLPPAAPENISAEFEHGTAKGATVGEFAGNHCQAVAQEAKIRPKGDEQEFDFIL